MKFNILNSISIIIVTSFAFCVIYYKANKIENLKIQLYETVKSVEQQEQQVAPSATTRKFYVIIAYFNPLQYKSRLKQYLVFEKHITQFNIELVTVELAFENQTFQVTIPTNSNHIQLRTMDIMFYKENLINIALKRLPKACEYVAWIDADVQFDNMNWVEDTIKALEEYKIVQMFQYTKFMGPNDEILLAYLGYGYSYAKATIGFSPGDTRRRRKILQKIFMNKPVEFNLFPRTGLAWACKKSTLLSIGGLFDKHILGYGDYLMASALVGNVLGPVKFKLTKSFRDELLDWQSKVLKHIQKKLGFVKGCVRHLWHGSLENRQYVNKESLLDSGPEIFSPKDHLYYDKDGLLRYDIRLRKYLQNGVRSYLLDRKEDEKV